MKNFIALLLMALVSVSVIAPINNAESAEMMLENKNVPVKSLAVNGISETVIKALQTQLSKQNPVEYKGKKLNLEGKTLSLEELIEETGDLCAQVAPQSQTSLILQKMKTNKDIFNSLIEARIILDSEIKSKEKQIKLFKC